MSDRGLWTPLRLAVWWLAGTFVLFLLVGQTDEVENLDFLSVYVGLNIVCFALGYRVRAYRYKRQDQGSTPDTGEESPDKITTIKFLVAVSGLYYLAYGVIYAREYGVGSLGLVLDAVRDPGAAYYAKFDVYARQEAAGQVNGAAQVLTLAAGLSAPLVPFMVVYWKRITGDIRLLGLVGLVAYVGYFMAIGTLAGLGQTVIFAGVALAVRGAQRQTRSQTSRRRVAGLVLGLGFALYMSYTQGERLAELSERTASKYEPNPVVEAVAGEAFARGVTSTSYYPTHGYQGLALNLQTPFQWTHGQGASRAIDSYVAQYGLAESVADDTYPARTEVRTGWPAGQLWATIYPWLASDLTWFGVLGFMFVLGWWTARWWYEAVVERSRLALLLLCQAGLLIAFIPANNQIGASRPYTIAAATLLLLYIVRPTARPKRIVGGSSRFAVGDRSARRS